MSFQEIVFYGFAGLMILSALMVVSSKNSVKAALFLVLTFVAGSGIWMLLEAEFLAISLIVVYVGAVMVLLLFVVMMLDIDYAALRQGFVKKLPVALIISLGFLAILFSFITSGEFSAENFAVPEPKPADYSNIKAIGQVLYTDYFIAFEIAAIILLVAIVAAISLTFRGRRNRKGQVVSKQLQANKRNRLKVVKMEAVKKNNDANVDSTQQGESE